MQKISKTTFFFRHIIATFVQRLYTFSGITTHSVRKRNDYLCSIFFRTDLCGYEESQQSKTQ